MYLPTIDVYDRNGLKKKKNVQNSIVNRWSDVFIDTFSRVNPVNRIDFKYSTFMIHNNHVPTAEHLRRKKTIRCLSDNF